MEVHPSDILLRLAGRRLQFGPHAQGFIVDFDAAWELHRTVLCLGVQRAPKKGTRATTFSSSRFDSTARGSAGYGHTPVDGGQLNITGGAHLAAYGIAGNSEISQPGILRIPATQSGAASASCTVVKSTPNGARVDQPTVRGRRGRTRGSGRGPRVAGAH